MPNLAAAGPDQGPDQNPEAQGLQTDTNSPEELLWEFLRLWPAPGVSIPALSTEPHIIQAKASRADSTTLNADEITAIGLEIAFHTGVGPLDWLPMEADALRNAQVQPGSVWFFFRVWLGPDADIAAASLPDGAYYVTVRTATAPKAARNLPLLTIDPPNF